MGRPKVTTKCVCNFGLGIRVDGIPTGRYVCGMVKTDATPNARSKLLDAALVLIRTKGFSATTVDDLCGAAGVTKGAFFHHFKSKEELGVAAADYWSEVTGELFANAAYHKHSDPLERILGYLDFRKALLQGELPEFTCLVGTLVQETYDSAPAIREACGQCMVSHAATLEADIEAAIQQRGLSPDWTAKSLALQTQVVLQGAFVLAKATGSSVVAEEGINHLRRYIELLFGVGDANTDSNIPNQSKENQRYG